MKRSSQLVKIAQADEFIQDFKEGYDTMIERGGSNVSGVNANVSVSRALPHESKDLDLG